MKKTTTTYEISALTMGLSHSYTLPSGDEPQKICFMLTGCGLLFPFHFEFKNRARFSADSWTAVTQKDCILRIISSLDY